MKFEFGLDEIKGPFMTDLKNIRHENEALMRELEKTQCINRDIIYDHHSIAIMNSNSKVTPNLTLDSLDYEGGNNKSNGKARTNKPIL